MKKTFMTLDRLLAIHKPVETRFFKGERDQWRNKFSDSTVKVINIKVIFESNAGFHNVQAKIRVDSMINKKLLLSFHLVSFHKKSPWNILKESCYLVNYMHNSLANV